MNQHILLVTGHICSGKSTLYKFISKTIPYEKIDIRDIYSQSFEKSLNKIKLFNNVCNVLLQGKSCYVELIGNEDWFDDFKKRLNLLWVDLHEYELKRNSFATAKQALIERCDRDFNEEWSVAVYENEYDSMRNMYSGYSIMNPTAIQILTTKQNISYVSQKILKDIGEKK